VKEKKSRQGAVQKEPWVSVKMPECASIEGALQKLAQEALGYTMICKFWGCEEGKDADTRDRIQKQSEPMSRLGSCSRPFSMFYRENRGNVYSGRERKGQLRETDAA
jgi:hypothetical protein